MPKRDAQGRWLPGQSANPKGRPPKEREERYYEILMTKCTFKDWGAIVMKAVEQAKRGDDKAREWLSKYLVGNPEQPLSGGVEILVRYAEQANRDNDTEAT